MKTASWSLALVAAAGTVRATEEDCPETRDAHRGRCQHIQQSHLAMLLQ